MKLALATGNEYKFSEMKGYFDRVLPEVNLWQYKIDIPENQDVSPEDILGAKINHVKQYIKGPFIVDDANFLTERYEGFPGAYAKFINQTLGYDGWRRLFNDGDAISAVAWVGVYRQGVTNIFKGEISGVLSFAKNKHVDPSAPLNDIIFIPGSKCFLREALKMNNFKNHRMLALDELAMFLKSSDQIKSSERVSS